MRRFKPRKGLLAHAAPMRQKLQIGAYVVASLTGYAVGYGTESHPYAFVGGMVVGLILASLISRVFTDSRSSTGS